ncbi:MAG: hypothetical protein RL514_2949 [Verrucomicrobiota bacterium]|jgi:hypothetical protein
MGARPRGHSPQVDLVADSLADLTTKRGLLDTVVGVTVRRG